MYKRILKTKLTYIFFDEIDMLQYIHIQSVFLHQGEIEFCNYEKKRKTLGKPLFS